MSTFLLIIIVVLVQFLRKLTKTNPQFDEWNSKLYYFNLLTIAVYVSTFMFDAKEVVALSELSLMVFFTYILWQYQEVRPVKILLWGVVPYAVLFSIKKILMTATPDFWRSWGSIFDQLGNFAGVWLVALFFVANYQKNQVIKEQQKIQEQEEKIRLTEAQNAELERIVSTRTAEIGAQKEELEKALADLQAAQNQLIQSEKLASLGELTAGIAHEIQNPLNFVNNFSELSIDIANELRDELDKPNIDKELVFDLMQDLVQNQEKINHHGKRAASIVKGMLEHSRMGSGERQLTDLNALCDEYLRLAYHGMRAKDKSFQADFEFVADPALPSVKVVPQDIGRVLLNLINNAFQSPIAPGQATSRKKVVVSTQLQESSPQAQSRHAAGASGMLVVRVSDNGSGIPSEVLPKIFQPFFTTKPTGEGTGLGLSLSYDIITKGHAGSIEVETTEGQGTTFIVKLPI